MRIDLPDRNDLKAQLKTEIARFKELDAEKQTLWASIETANLQEWELLKCQWQDSAEEIKYLHRKIYPTFPRDRPCPVCGCDTMPIVGSNKHDMSGCIACDYVRVG